MSRARALAAGVAVLVAAGLIAGCTAGSAADPSPTTPEQTAAPFEVAPPAQATTVAPSGSPAELALATSRALFTAAPVVVLTAPGGPSQEATRAAADLGAPLLPLPDGDPAPLRAELDRLGAAAVLAPGLDRTVTDAALQGTGLDVETPDDLPDTSAATALSDVLVLTDGAPASAAAATTASAAGATVRALPSGDPRTDPETISALAEQRPTHVLALGDAFGDAGQLASRVEVASTGVQLPGGGQVLFPWRRLVALYGHPGTASLGVLGEQPVDQAVRRAKDVAAQYEPVSDVPVVPAFEIIATVASSAPGPDGDYSAESSVEELRPWVDAAAEAGVYVLLDLQPGTADFLTQAKRYTELLERPNVGLALDPEWRLRPGQRHLEQIGSVGVDEVNATAAWLADLTREKRLPQKVLVLHQFRLSMISGRARLDTGRDELAVVIHADGNGSPGDKLATWNALRADPPAGAWWGWKNFYDEDSPTFTPAQTMDLDPPPVLVTYQ